MADVPSGGRTVFPRIGAGVTPVAGAAVFWYNLRKSGDPDRNTLHGACPILYGTKWGEDNQCKGKREFERFSRHSCIQSPEIKDSMISNLDIHSAQSQIPPPLSECFPNFFFTEIVSRIPRTLVLRQQQNEDFFSLLIFTLFPAGKKSLLSKVFLLF